MSRIAEDVGNTSGGILHRPHATRVPRRHESNLGDTAGGRTVNRWSEPATTDACPGALQVHQAADGALARIRLPGGMITAGQLTTLANAATEFGSGTLELTARGNVQLRGITDTTAVAEAIARRRAAAVARPRTGPQHRRVTAVRPGRRDAPTCGLGGRAGRRDPRRAQAGADLGGRFWFSLDDGRGDVSGLGADVGAHVLDDGVALLLAGRDTGVRVAASAT